MLRLAVLTARGRTGAFTGALIALFAAAVLSMAWGMQLESILRTHPPVERYAAAAAVVTGQQNAGTDDKRPAQRASAGELPRSLRGWRPCPESVRPSATCRCLPNSAAKPLSPTAGAAPR